MGEISRTIGLSSEDAPALGGDRALRMRVETFAGDGIAGFADGPAATARFNQPWGVAVDAAGNVYVADSWNHRIRKISPDGMVSTLAGDGEMGFADGDGEEAMFQYPRGVVLDAAGNIYVADTNNDRVRKVTPQGAVTTHSGEGVRGFYDGARIYARFSLPNGIAIDGSGHLYVADATNYRVRKVSPGGTASTVAGDGVSGFCDTTGKEARFSSPRSVGVDAVGNVYVTEVGNSRIRKISPLGVVSTFAGDGRGAHSDGVGTAASFREPCGLAVDATGTVFVADTDNHCIRMISPDGHVVTIAGDGKAIADLADGLGPDARFSTPTGLCITPTGVIYVADAKNHCIRRLTPA